MPSCIQEGIRVLLLGDEGVRPPLPLPAGFPRLQTRDDAWELMAGLASCSLASADIGQHPLPPVLDLQQGEGKARQSQRGCKIATASL